MEPRTLTLTGGDWRRAKLYSVPGRDVRPALARLRVSLFEILRPRLDGAHALDLFAGTGSLGFEALSRGAASCLFFDVDPRCVEVLRKNIEKLKAGPRAAVIQASAFSAAELIPSSRSFDLVFVDPPYPFYDDATKAADLERAVAALKPRLRPGALLLVEHRSGKGLGETWAGGRQTDERIYGGTTLTFYES